MHLCGVGVSIPSCSLQFRNPVRLLELVLTFDDKAIKFVHDSNLHVTQSEQPKSTKCCMTNHVQNMPESIILEQLCQRSGGGGLNVLYTGLAIMASMTGLKRSNQRKLMA